MRAMIHFQRPTAPSSYWRQNNAWHDAPTIPRQAFCIWRPLMSCTDHSSLVLSGSAPLLRAKNPPPKQQKTTLSCFQVSRSCKEPQASSSNSVADPRTLVAWEELSRFHAFCRAPCRDGKRAKHPSTVEPHQPQHQELQACEQGINCRAKPPSHHQLSKN